MKLDEMLLTTAERMAATDAEIAAKPDEGLWTFDTLLTAQRDKTLRAVAEWLETEMVEVWLRTGHDISVIACSRAIEDTLSAARQGSSPEAGG